MPDINVNKISEALNTKADIDLNNTGVFSTSGGRGVNLTSSTPADAIGKEVTTADFIKSDIQSNLLNYTTNRILEIPQDIKLEINSDKRLVLKAGSKLYYPNGFEEDGKTRKFDTFIAGNDVISGKYGVGREVLVVYSFHVNNFEWSTRNNFYSGNTQPTDSWYVWYDTETNFIRWKNGTSNGTCTFPICFLTENPESASGLHDGGIKSIDQVFNGFGYIGSTVFALPGVKVQIPNGRNEDGTYRITPYTTQNVITREVTGTGVKDITLQPNGILNWATGGLYLAEDGYHHGYTVNSINISAVLARVLITTAGKIDSFVPRNVDSIANSNASNFSQAGRSYLSGLGMPSNKYINLTLGASGSTYTAPANGTFSLWRNSGTGSQLLGVIINVSKNYGSYLTLPSGAGDGYVNLSVEQGNIVAVKYAGTFEGFRFIYAKGDQ